MKPKAIIIDLDGTLCDNAHRQHHVEKSPKDWKAFFAGLDEDKPHAWCDSIYYAFSMVRGVTILFVSGRGEEYRERTEKWLDKHDINFEDRLFMRPAGDFRDDTIVKEELYRQHIEPHYQVLFCVDDRPKVARMWRSIGLVCLQCGDREF